MDSLGALNAFVQAAESRSFTAAGQRLGVSSSAISKAVMRLEERMGVRLLHRSTRSIALTPEGACFLERCRRILAEMEAAETEISQSRVEPAGRLRVSLPVAGMLFMPTLAAFMEAWPSIELELDFTDHLVDVIEDGFDAVIRSGEIGDSRLMRRALGRFSFVLVGSPDYFARHGKPRTIGDLAGHRALRHIYPSTGRLEDWPVEAEIPTAAVVNAIEPLICLAERGLGIASLPEFAVRDQLARGQLVAVLEGIGGRSGQMSILWPGSRHPTPRLRVFVDFMAERLFSPPREARHKPVSG